MLRCYNNSHSTLSTDTPRRILGWDLNPGLQQLQAHVQEEEDYAQDHTPVCVLRLLTMLTVSIKRKH